MPVAKKINDGDEDDGDDDFEICETLESLISQGVNNRMKRRKSDGREEMETFVVSVDIRMRSRGCVRVFYLAVQSWFSSQQAFCSEDRMREAGEVGTAILAAYTILSLPHICASFLCASRACVSRTAPLDFFSFLFGGAIFFFLSFIFFFFFYFVHPLTRAAGRFQQKCDTNGAIQI